MALVETLPDADVDDTPPPVRPDDLDPVEARAVLDSVAARMFGAPPEPLRVGRFVLLERIGRGGMGVVYAAYDPELDRKIAIKLIASPGEGSAANPEADARLAREARAAARLDHSNVVTIHEVGTWDGRVYLAMEFVDGVTLKVWSAAKTRALAEIIEVFVQAGRGLAAAHAVGVVHRDFKPDNVLVGRDGKVRVVDFGLARASAAEVAVTAESGPSCSDTSLTRTGTIMGTPAYMAPEQHRGELAGVAADQFAFCVALWEACYGVRPFLGDSVGALAIEVLEGHIGAPPADTRVPARVRRILERGLATDPAARHPSMDALLAALARDPGRRVRHIAAAGVVASALLGTGLAVGLGAADDPCGGGDERYAAVWNDARRTEVANTFTATGLPYANAALARVERELDARAEPWIRTHRDACEATRVRGEQSDELLDLRMACLDRRLAELGSLVDLLADADAKTVTHALRPLDGLAPIETCSDATALRTPVPLPDDPAQRSEIAAIADEVTRGSQLRDIGRFADGIAIGTDAVAAARTIGHAPTIADALVLLGSSLAHAGELERAREILEAGVWAAIAGRNTTAHASATTALVTITGHSLEDVDTGARWGEHARAVLRADGDPPERLAALEGNFGNLAMTRGDRTAALTHFREAVRLYEIGSGPEHSNVGRMMANVAVVLRRQGELNLADQTYARALLVLESALGPGHPDLGPVLSNSGAVLHARGQLNEALLRYRAALAIGQASLEPNHPQLGHANNNIGETLLELGDATGAERHARAAIEIWETALGREHSLLASPYGVLGRALHARAENDLAIAALEHALALPTSGAVAATDLAQDRFSLAQALWSRPSDRARARQLAAQARETLAAHGSRSAAIDGWLATHMAP